MITQTAPAIIAPIINPVRLNKPLINPVVFPRLPNSIFAPSDRSVNLSVPPVAHCALVSAKSATLNNPFIPRIPPPIAIAIFPASVSNNPDISPLKTSQMISNAVPKCVAQSIEPINSPIFIPNVSQSVFSATYWNVPRSFVTNSFNFCPFSSHWIFSIAVFSQVVSPCAISSRRILSVKYLTLSNNIFTQVAKPVPSCSALVVR